MKKRKEKTYHLDIQKPQAKDDTVITIGLILNNNNDQQHLSAFLRKLDSIISKTYAFYEILLIENGLNDSIYTTIRQLQKQYSAIRALVLSRRYDRESAFLAIFEHAIGDYIVIMDIQTDPPEDVPLLLAKATSGFDIVTGLPVKKAKRSWIEQITFTFLNKISRNLIGFEVDPDAPYFLVLSRRVVNTIVQYRNKRRFLTYLNTIIGFKQGSIHYQPRVAKPTMNLWQSCWFIIDVVITNSSIPLRLAAFLGAFSSFIYLIYVFVIALVKKNVTEGWITMSVLNATMFFLLFVILMILSEYIDRIIHETKDQPPYIVADELTSSDLPYQKKRLNVV